MLHPAPMEAIDTKQTDQARITMRETPRGWRGSLHAPLLHSLYSSEPGSIQTLLGKLIKLGAIRPKDGSIGGVAHVIELGIESNQGGGSGEQTPENVSLEHVDS